MNIDAFENTDQYYRDKKLSAAPDIKRMHLIIGVAGIVLAWSLAFAQLLKTFKSQEGLSTITWTAYFVVNISWLVYSLNTENFYLTINMAGSAALSSVIVVRTAKKPLINIVLASFASILIILLSEMISWSFGVSAITLLAMWLRWPQVKELLVKKDVSGVSVSTWVLFTINNIIWIAVSIQSGDFKFAAANILMGVSSATVAVLAWWRNNHRFQTIHMSSRHGKKSDEN